MNTPARRTFAAAVIAAGFAAAAECRVAVLPSQCHQTEFDGNFAAIGAETTHLKYGEFFSGRAFDDIEAFDAVAVPPLFNCHGEFDKIPPSAVGVVFGRLRDWVKAGGVLFMPDANHPYPMCNDRLSVLDPALVLLPEGGQCGCRAPGTTSGASAGRRRDRLGCRP